MKIFCLSDPHLGFGVNKPMDIYGPLWQDHPEKIRRHWLAKVSEDDLVIVPGDISWANNAEQVKKDMDFFGALPGKIIFGKGNHENWWNSHKKTTALIPDNAYLVDASHPYTQDDLIIAGTRMWDNLELKFLPWIQLNEGTDENDITPKNPEETKRIFDRECDRLKRSLENMKNYKYRIAAIHYPPTTPEFPNTIVTDIIRDAGAQHCVFGHIHSMKEDTVFEGKLDEVTYYCCSCDYINFDPVLITEI